MKAPEVLSVEEAQLLEDPEQVVPSATHGYKFTDMARKTNVFDLNDAYISSFFFDSEGNFAGVSLHNPSSGEEFFDTAMPIDMLHEVKN